MRLNRLVPFLSALLVLSVSGHGAEKVGFDRLANFPYEAPGYDPDIAAKAPAGQIPDEVRALDGKEATVVGYMLPTRLEGTLVKEFLLVKDQAMCCYGAVPRVNEWVIVTMAKPVPLVQDLPRAVTGRLFVGEIYENGFMTGLYRMDGVRISEPTP